MPYDQFANFPIKKEDLNELHEDKDIEEIRRIKKEEWKKKEEEAKVKTRIERDVKEKEFEITKKQKEYERKNVTTDANGNIIFIKSVQIDKLTQEFINTKFDIKDKAEVTGSLMMPRVEKSIPNVRKEVKLGTSDKLVNKNKIMETVQLTTGSNFEKPPERVEKYEKAAIVPAGSSFDLISPEIGVTIIEGAKLKTGGTGRDFSKAFKKYSKYDYMNAKDSENFYTSSLKESLFDPIPIDYNFNPPRESNVNAFSLPKIPETSSTIKTQFVNTNLGSIKLNTKYGTLKSALDGLDLIPEYDENIVNENKDQEDFLNNSNIFKKTKFSKFEETNNNEGYIRSLEEINKFNLSIVKNSQWGSNKTKLNTDKHANKTFYKPSKKEVEKEVGKNVADTKLPRSRIFSYVNAQQSMNSTANSFRSTKGKNTKLGEIKKNFNKTATKFEVDRKI